MREKPSEAVASQAERWLARLYSPDCTADDRTRFETWLTRHPSHREAYAHAEYVWSLATEAKSPEMEAFADDALRQGKRRRKAAASRTRLFSWAAAWCVITAGLTFAFVAGWQNLQTAAGGTATYSTDVGQIRVVTLEDRSTVTLNTDTVLDVRIGRRARTVTLQRGEAQFSVAPDRRPFTVATPLADVTALGTLFQVRATDAATEVSLLEGRVRVTSPDGGTAQREELAPGDRLVARASAAWERGRANVEAAAGWPEGRLVFDAMPLRDAIDEFNRYSLRKLRIGDPAIGDIPVAGIFNSGDADSIALALRHAYGLRTDDRGAEVVLLRE